MENRKDGTIVNNKLGRENIGPALILSIRLPSREERLNVFLFHHGLMPALLSFLLSFPVEKPLSLAQLVSTLTSLNVESFYGDSSSSLELPPVVDQPPAGWASVSEEAQREIEYSYDSYVEWNLADDTLNFIELVQSYHSFYDAFNNGPLPMSVLEALPEQGASAAVSFFETVPEIPIGWSFSRFQRSDLQTLADLLPRLHESFGYVRCRNSLCRLLPTSRLSLSK